MANGKAIGAIEFSSVGLGYLAQDEMLKAGAVNPRVGFSGPGTIGCFAA